MKYVLGLIIVAVAASPAFAIPAPGPELAVGFPSVIAVIGAYAATRFLRKR